MTHEKQNQDDKQRSHDKPVGMPKDTTQPKTESTAEYEGQRKPDQPTGNPAVEVKPDSSSGSGE